MQEVPAAEERGNNNNNTNTNTSTNIIIIIIIIIRIQLHFTRIACSILLNNACFVDGLAQEKAD